jgi:hypothetical protein
MAFGFPYPRYVARRTFDLPQRKLFAAVESALQGLGWSYKVPWGKEFEAWIPTTRWSWHHEFNVRFPSGGVVEAESRSAYREMFFDFGRNRKNAETFFARAEQVIERPSGDNP